MPTIDTLIFDPSPCGFPVPRVSLLPTLHQAAWDWHSVFGVAADAWAPASHFRHFTRGRYALHEAYRTAGIAPGTTLLAPAYHCRTMLDPALALGADVALYPLDEALRPDLVAIDLLTGKSADPVKAIVATHYFGFPQDFTGLAQWSNQRGIALIEDCSHVLFCERYRAVGTGTFGDFVTGSPYKFLPSPDGGLLYARDAHRLAGVKTRRGSIDRELRGIEATLSKAWSNRRTAAACDPEASPFDRTKDGQPGSERHERAGVSVDYQPEDEGLARLGVSHLIERCCRIEDVIARRQRNYQFWLDAVTGLPSCRPVYPILPTGCVPYMFPLYIDHPEPIFYQLKRSGIPIWRWDSMAASNCATASNYRTRLLHLPCHQSLRDAEMDWMVAAVTKASQMSMRGATA